MKFIGQFIQSLIARFRNDVYLEDISTGTIASGSNLGLDSNNKIVKAAVPTDTNTQNTYAISCVDGDNSDEEKIRLTQGGADGAATDDVVLEAGTGLSIARSGDKITFTNTVSDTNTMGSGFTVSATTDSNATTITQGDDLFFAAGTGITCETTADGTVTITNTVTDTNTQLTNEQVQDIVGAMFTGNTETNITATYQDSDGTIDLAATDTNTNQLTTFTLTADGGSNQTIAHGNTLRIAGGEGIVTTVSATDTVTAVLTLTELTQDASTAIDGDNDELIYLESGGGEDFIQKRRAFGSIPLSTFHNDQGFTNNTGDITGVTAGTNLSGGGSSGGVTINLANASTSVKGAASFSSTNFSVSSGAVTIKSGGVDLADEVTGVLPTANIADDAVTFAKAQGVAPNVFNNTIKLIPSDFATNGDGGNTKFGVGYTDSPGTGYGMRVPNNATELYTFVSIPQGMKATSVDIFDKTNLAFEVFEIQINATTMTSKGSGNCNTTLTLSSAVESSATNLLAIEVLTTSTSDRVYGGKVTIAAI